MQILCDHLVRNVQIQIKQGHRFKPLMNPNGKDRTYACNDPHDLE